MPRPEPSSALDSTTISRAKLGDIEAFTAIVEAYYARCLRFARATLRNPDFQLYARSFGVAAWATDNADGLRTALSQALAANAPALIEVRTDIAQEASPWEFIAPMRR